MRDLMFNFNKIVLRKWNSFVKIAQVIFSFDAVTPCLVEGSDSSFGLNASAFNHVPRVELKVLFKINYL